MNISVWRLEVDGAREIPRPIVVQVADDARDANFQVTIAFNDEEFQNLISQCQAVPRRTP
jgi:hypothetical protein